MIRVTVELISAVHHSRSTVLGMMVIANDGETSLDNPNLGTYIVKTYRGRSRETLEQGRIQKQAKVERWRRKEFHIWNLVRRALEEMGYNKGPVTF